MERTTPIQHFQLAKEFETETGLTIRENKDVYIRWLEVKVLSLDPRTCASRSRPSTLPHTSVAAVDNRRPETDMEESDIDWGTPCINQHEMELILSRGLPASILDGFVVIHTEEVNMEWQVDGMTLREAIMFDDRTMGFGSCTVTSWVRTVRTTSRRPSPS